MSRKNDINTDHYKTVGRGRQMDDVIHRHAPTQTKSGIRVRGAAPFIGDCLRRLRDESRMEGIRKARSLRRLRKVRGLSARQLLERKMRRSATERAITDEEGRVNTVVKKLYRSWAAYRRRRAFSKVRREFAKAGYPLDGLSDSQVEAALTNGEGRITDIVLSAKIIHHALRRLINMRPGLAVIRASGATKMRGPFP